MSNKKKSSITHIRSWVRTNGEMSEDGKSITYSCAELEAVIREAKAMHKEEIKDAFVIRPYTNFEKYYNETFGGNNE
jgi:hypothetical protein